MYEVSTETLFLGRQDAMQRQTLVPLHKFVMSRPDSSAGLRALEVAAGTGRFATFIKVTGATKTPGKLALRHYVWDCVLCFIFTADKCVSCPGPSSLLCGVYVFES